MAIPAPKLLITKVNNFQLWIVGLILLTFVSIGLLLRGVSPQPQVDTQTVPVQSKTLAIRIAANGTVVPRQSVNLSPKTAGRIAKLYVEQGDSVVAGQVIARMENSDFAAQLAQARANLAQNKAQLALLKAGTRPEEILQARANLAQAEAQLIQALTNEQLSRLRLRRYESLFVEGAISQDRYDEAQNDEASALSKVAVANATLQQVKARLAQLIHGNRLQEIDRARFAVEESQSRLRVQEIQWQDSYVRSPFSGIVTQKYATAGAFVTPTTSASSTTSATSTSIVAIAQGLEVLAKVPEADIAQVKQGQSVEIVADAYPDQVVPGKVRLIAPEAVLEANVTAFQVRLSFDKKYQILRSNMNVTLVFIGEQIPNALVVPTVAIVTVKGHTGLLVKDLNQQPKFHPVTIGPTVGNETQILKGIQPGERVFVDLPKEQMDKLLGGV